MKRRSRSLPGRSDRSGAALFVKRLEELIGLVDELLNATARFVGFGAPLPHQCDGDAKRHAGHQTGGADPEQRAQVFLTGFRQLLPLLDV